MFLKKTFDKRMKKYLLKEYQKNLSNFESNFVKVESSPPFFSYKNPASFKIIIF